MARRKVKVTFRGKPNQKANIGSVRFNSGETHEVFEDDVPDFCKASDQWLIGDKAAEFEKKQEETPKEEAPVEEEKEEKPEEPKEEKKPKKIGSARVKGKKKVKEEAEEPKE